MIEKITKEKADELSVSSLPTRPNAPTSSGGVGYSSADMKQAFDALTLYVIEKYNELIDAIYETDSSSLSAAIPTGLSDGHTLNDLFTDLKNGNLASYLSVGDNSLASELAEIRLELQTIKRRVGL